MKTFHLPTCHLFKHASLRNPTPRSNGEHEIFVKGNLGVVKNCFESSSWVMLLTDAVDA